MNRYGQLKSGSIYEISKDYLGTCSGWSSGSNTAQMI
jgi:hypothetical protein